MDQVKKPYREAEQETKEAWRRSDGHEDVRDKIGNAGDEVRKDLGNAGDDLRRDMDRKSDRDRDVEQPTTTPTTPR